METIYKYLVPLHENELIIRMPRLAMILCVQIDEKDGNPYIWALVATNTEMIDHKFLLYGTGHETNPCISKEYIGTFQVDKGAFVGHLFKIHHQTSI